MALDSASEASCSCCAKYFYFPAINLCRLLFPIFLLPRPNVPLLEEPLKRLLSDSLSEVVSLQSHLPASRQHGAGRAGRAVGTGCPRGRGCLLSCGLSRGSQPVLPTGGHQPRRLCQALPANRFLRHALVLLSKSCPGGETHPGLEGDTRPPDAERCSDGASHQTLPGSGSCNSGRASFCYSC